jgi:peptidoglycan hydrolase CwlO-like protein
MPTSATPSGSQPDMQEQIRDLTNSNQELREQLDQQKSKMKDLTEDMNRLKRELDQTNVGKPPARKPAQ